MSVEERLHQMEERIEWLEQSYKRLLNGILRALGKDIEKGVEG